LTWKNEKATDWGDGSDEDEAEGNLEDFSVAMISSSMNEGRAQEGKIELKKTYGRIQHAPINAIESPHIHSN
jgi:hypothetical protein